MLTAIACLLALKPPHVVVLTYHDVVPGHMQGRLWFDTTETQFQRDIAAMRRSKVSFITLDQLYQNLTNHRPLPPRPVCLTFADNYEGFRLRALPVLERYRIPGAMFVHTGFVGSPIGRPKMTWLELEAIDREGLVEIASQTVSHPLDLRELGPNALKAEFVRSKLDLEAHLGHPVLDIAYPNGKFGPACLKLAREAGYRMAFSEVCAPADLSPSIFAVNRYVSTQWRLALRWLH